MSCKSSRLSNQTNFAKGQGEVLQFHYCNSENLLRLRQTSCVSHPPSHLSLLLFLPAQHQFGACLVVKLRSDLEALSLGELVARHLASSAVRDFVGSGRQPKLRPSYFFPCRLHLSDSLHNMFVLLTRQLFNLERCRHL